MTLNDVLAAKLISRSLVERLTDEEQAQLHDYLITSEKSQKFAELSTQIQRILAGEEFDQPVELLAQSVQPDNPTASSEVIKSALEPGPGLSQLSRARIARRLAEEISAGSSSDTDPSEYDRPGRRMVAEDETTYRQDGEPEQDDESN